MPGKPISQDWHFPKAGIDLSRPANQQPLRPGPHGERHYYCADALNVLSYDALAHRQRGGSRPGLAKPINDQVRGASILIQQLDQLVGSGYNPPGGGAVQSSQSGRVVTIVAVAQGYVEVRNPDDTVWSTTTNSAVNTPPLNASGIVYSTPLLQDLFFADGLTPRVYYDPATNTVDDWVATAGAMPEDSGNGPRLICTWRGRVIQSGIISDPQNIFASEIGDPRNFDYSPANPSSAQAWALNLSDIGLIGDIVTGLIPSTDDVLVVLCDHSVHKVTGDPADGGTRDLVCEGIGGAWGQAWCNDPAGNIYFFGNVPGVFIMPPMAAGPPQRISHQIDPILRDVNTGTNTIRLFWDDLLNGFWMFITPTSAEATDPDTVTHFFYEAPRPDGSGGGWFKVRFADTSMNPLCGVTVDGNEPGDRHLEIGSWDGYSRGPDPDATDDDGTPIDSYVLIGPILTPNMDEVKLMSMQGNFAEGSDDVDYSVLLGKTAELAINDTTATVAPRIGTFGASRGYTKRVNRAANAIFLKLASVGIWAVESIRVVMGRTLSIKRGRGNR